MSPPCQKSVTGQVVFRERADRFVNDHKKGLKNRGLPVTIREMQRETAHHLVQGAVISVLAGAVLTILAPLGTHNYSFAMRALYWVGLCFTGGVGAMLSEYAYLKASKKTRNDTRAPWLIAFWQSIGATVMVAAFLIIKDLPGPPTQVAMSLFYIWVIAIVISAIGALRSTQQRGEAGADNHAIRPAIIDRIKPSLRDAHIYALSAEDHYVRVITSGGEDLVLMRLSDAVKETAPLVGLSPHRSWWVAEAGTDSVTRKDSKIILILKSGQTVPVSRNGAKTVRAAGWL